MPVLGPDKWDSELKDKLDKAVEDAKTDDEYRAAMKAVTDYKGQFIPAGSADILDEENGDDRTGQPAG